MNTSKRRNIQIIILAYLIMAVFGFFMNLKGPVIPSVRMGFNVNYSSIGFMILMTDVGYMIATFFGGIAAEKFGIKSILIFGFIVVILSALSMKFINAFSLYVIIMFFITLGMGCFEIGLNSLGARVFITNAAVMMNLMHLFYGVGSTISPKYAGWLLAEGISWRSVYLYSLAILLIVLVFLLVTPFPEKKEEHINSKIPFKKIVSDKKLWLFSGVLGFCIVSEIAVGNWLINFLQVIHKMNENESSMYLSFFFIAFTIGRLVGGFIVEKTGYVKALIYFTISYILFFSGGLFLGGKWTILFSLTGFSVSIMYPTIITIIMKEFKEDTTVIMGFIITASGLFNMISSWLIGKTSDLFGVYIGFASILLYISLQIILLFILKRVVKYDKTIA